MRIRTAALWAVLGMVSTSAVALAIPVPPAQSASPDPGVVVRGGAIGSDTGEARKAKRDPSHLTDGKSVLLDVRLGHASVARGPARETYLFASVTGGDTASVEAPPLNLAIVIDRSGSMAGMRMANAIAGAVGAVERMREGDSVTVVSFDTVAKVVVPPTRTTGAAKPDILRAVRGIRLGGDTCISCGLELAMQELNGTTLSRDQINRMILLSDGEPTDGVKDVPGFRAMALRMRDKGFAITTIGVDTKYEERVMAAIAEESNGNHFFVANPTGLPAVFEKEFQSLVASVGSDTELAVDIEPGVQVDEVFDRSFRREGRRIIIPFGTLAAGEEKTVLMKLKVPADRDGEEPICQVKLAYRDVVERRDATAGGGLGLWVRSDRTEQRTLDPYVEARIERTKTASSLERANDLVNQGKIGEARAVLQHQKAELTSAASAAIANTKSAPEKRAGRGLAGDFEEQTDTIAKAEKNLGPAPPAGHASPMPAPTTTARAVKEAQEQISNARK